MFYERSIAGQKAAPDWVVCDREEEISDIWIDHMDPKNEDGAVVTVFLHHNQMDAGMHFKGIRIVDADGAVTFWDRNRCMKYDRLFCALYNLEDKAMQAPGYGSDDRYDEWKEAL